MSITRPSDFIILGKSLDGVKRISLMWYQAKRATPTFDTLYFVIPEFTSETFSNQGGSRFPLYLSDNNQPIFLNVPVYVFDGPAPMQGMNGFHVEVTTADRSTPAVFTEIELFFEMDVLSVSPDMDTGSAYMAKFGNALMQR